MEYEMKMPDLSTAADEVTITEWFVAIGEKVQRGQPILNVETDKAEMEVESVVDGVLKKVVVQDGQTVASGTVVGIFEVDSSSPPATPAANSPAETLPPPAIDPPAAQRPRKDSPAGGMFARNRQRRDQSDR